MVIVAGQPSNDVEQKHGVVHAAFIMSLFAPGISIASKALVQSTEALAPLLNLTCIAANIGLLGPPEGHPDILILASYPLPQDWAAPVFYWP